MDSCRHHSCPSELSAGCKATFGFMSQVNGRPMFGERGRGRRGGGACLTRESPTCASLQSNLRALAISFDEIYPHQALCTFLSIYPFNHPRRLISQSICVASMPGGEMSGRRSQKKINSHLCTAEPEDPTGPMRRELGLSLRSWI